MEGLREATEAERKQDIKFLTHILYNPDPIRFFFWHKPEGLLIANFRFRVSYSRCNSRNLNKLHILIRTPLICIERNNGGMTIGNKHQLYFVNNKPRRSKTDDESGSGR